MQNWSKVKKYRLVHIFILLVLLIAIGLYVRGIYEQEVRFTDRDIRYEVSEEEWEKQLSPEEYNINREAGTEPAFSGDLLNEKRPGTYYDVTGTQALFRSEDKFDSGTGWPSFTKPISEEAVILKPDYTYGLIRTEIISSDYGHHLGHVFNDGPEPTGLRYCINSASLTFVPDNP